MASGSILAHLEALRKTLFEVMAIFVVLLIPGWYFAGDVLAFMEGAAIRAAEGCQVEFSLHYFGLLEPFMVELKAGMLLAFGAGLPLYFWRLWKFVAPALYRHEKKVLLSCSVVAWGLFFIGFFAGIFGVMPLLVKFSLSYARSGLTPEIGLGNFIDLMLTLALAFGVMFELPLLMLLLVICGVVKLETLKKHRPTALIIILVLAAFLTPPDVISQLMLGIPTYLLYELMLTAGSILLRKRSAESESVDYEAPVKTPQLELPEDPCENDYTFNRYYRKRRTRQRPGSDRKNRTHRNHLP